MKRNDRGIIVNTDGLCYYRGITDIKTGQGFQGHLYQRNMTNWVNYCAGYNDELDRVFAKKQAAGYWIASWL